MKKYSENEIELIKLLAVRDYLLLEGRNNEVINEKIREIEKRLRESRKSKE